MPRKGYKCITVTDEVHIDISRRAKETKRTMREYIEYLLQKDKDTKEENNDCPLK